MDGILDSELLLIDTQTMNIRKLRYNSNKEREKVTELSEEAISCALGLDEEQSLDVSGTKQNMKEISPLEYVDKVKNGWKPFFLDVRREEEEKIVTLPNTNLRISHTEVPSRLQEIPDDQDIVIYCRSGARSAMVANFLKMSGDYSMEVYNLSGGIHLWSSTVDSSIPKY